MAHPWLTDPARIQQTALIITSSFEGGKYDSFQNYDAGIVSYGLFQFTLSSGSLAMVVKKYLATATSATAKSLEGFLPRLLARDASLRYDQVFKQLLIAAAREQAMQAAQLATAVELYWDKAQEISVIPRGVKTPLGQALFFDLAIHYGTKHTVASRAEKKLGVEEKSKVGENGITEQQLLKEMASIRRSDHYAQAARTGYTGLRVRGDFWVDLTQKGDWNLEGDADGNVVIFGRKVKIWEQPATTTQAIPEATRMKQAAFQVVGALLGMGSYDSYALSDEEVIRYGRLGFSLVDGALSRVVDRYFTLTRGLTGGLLRTYQSRIRMRDVTLKNDDRLHTAFTLIRNDPACMQAQDAIADEIFWQPIKTQCAAVGLETALAHALVLDIVILRDFTTVRDILLFAEEQAGGKPINGRVSESQFVSSMMNAYAEKLGRLRLMRGDASITDRAVFWKKLIASNDWHLAGDSRGEIEVNGQRVQVRSPLY